MYKLTLTLDERKAIEFLGRAYATGSEFMYKLIPCIPEKEYFDDGFEWCAEVAWYMEGDITFKIPENHAWSIQELFAEENNLFPMFCDSFKSKLMRFSDSIV